MKKYKNQMNLFNNKVHVVNTLMEPMLEQSTIFIQNHEVMYMCLRFRNIFGKKRWHCALPLPIPPKCSSMTYVVYVDQNINMNIKIAANSTQPTLAN